MSWDWYNKKNTNYYNRLALVNKVKKCVESLLPVNTPLPLLVPYSYTGGRKNIVSIERYQYFSQFKRVFTTIRVKLTCGTFVPLAKLRTKHLTLIYQQLHQRDGLK